LDRAGRIFSENASLHYARAVALENVDRRAEAEQELRTTLELGSDNYAVLELAGLYERQGRFAEEATVLRFAAERSLRPPYTLYLKLGYAQLAMGESRQALTSFDQAEKESPFVGEAYELGVGFRTQIAEGRRLAYAAALRDRAEAPERAHKPATQ